MVEVVHIQVATTNITINKASDKGENLTESLNAIIVRSMAT